LTTLFTNARLIDPEALTETLGALLVKDGKIAEIFDHPDPDLGSDGIPIQFRYNSDCQFQSWLTPR
jgi:dihydroorotase